VRFSFSPPGQCPVIIPPSQRPSDHLDASAQFFAVPPDTPSRKRGGFTVVQIKYQFLPIHFAPRVNLSVVCGSHAIGGP
jgi:hypothetical protein